MSAFADSIGERTSELKPALELRDVWFGYSAGRPVLRQVGLAVHRGQITMLMGTSGSGKTSLLKLAKGLLAPERGSIHVLGQPVVPATRGRRLDRRVAYIPQQLGLVRTLSASENVLMGALGHVGTLRSLVQVFPHEFVERGHDLLGQFGIAHKASEKVYALSGGERQRVAIARALMQWPGVLLADEFVSQLDPVTTGEIMQAVRRIANDGVAVVIATHELDIVSRYADRVLVLRDGQLALDRPGAEAPVDELASAMRR